MAEQATFTDALDHLCDHLTAMVLRADHLRDAAPPYLSEMTDFDRLVEVLDEAAEIAEQTLSVAMLGEGLGEHEG